MKLAGFSVNLFSLGGLVVALGVILDNSIVVLENITRLKAEGTADYALRGTNEVGTAIMAATLTFLAIFLPFLFVPGLGAILFKELVLVVAGIVMISLIVAVTLTPLLTERLLRKERLGHLSLAAGTFDSVIGWLTGAYSRLLRVCLGVKWLVVILTVAIFAAGLWLATLVGSEFLPKVDDGRVMVKVKMPSGTAVGEVDWILAQLEAKLQGMPEIESIFSLAGGKVWGLYTYEIANEGELNIQLVPKARRKISTKDFIQKIKPLVKTVPAPGGKIPVMQMKVKGIRKVGEQEVEVKVKGTKIVPIFEFAREVADRLNKSAGITNVNVSMDMTKPEYRIYIDRARASSLGISVGNVASTLRALIHGVVSTQYREGTEYYDIRVMVPEAQITSKTDLENLVLESDRGHPMYLRDIAEVRRTVGPVEIIREDRAKMVIVRADAAGISVGEAVALAENAVAGLHRPAGVEYEMGGITSQGVVLLVLAEAYRKDGHKPLDAILHAAPIRVRPILMTQLTTVLGIVPLAINLGEGGDMLQPMAIAVIGGLLYSLVLTLLFLPAAYAKVSYDLSIFQKDGTVVLPVIREVTNENCLFCHRETDWKKRGASYNSRGEMCFTGIVPKTLLDKITL